MEHASELRGLLVVASDEGAQLGNLSGIYIDPAKKSIAALTFRTRRLGGDEYFVAIGDVKTVGRDVVLISSEAAAQKISDEEKPPGKSLKELQGAWVTTMDGDHLGALVDLDFSDDWRISELSLANDGEVQVEANDIKIGDAIIVPVEYAERVRRARESSPGFLRRAFGGESLEDTKQALKRALTRQPRKPPEESEHPQQNPPAA